MPKEELKSEIREMTRSFQPQGRRCDQDLCKAEQLPHKDDGSLAHSVAILKLRIDNDPEYRTKLFRVMLNVSSHVLPARYLRSELYCYAYTEAVRLGEVEQDMLGRRARRDYDKVE